MGRTRFHHNNNTKDPDPFIQLLFDLSRPGSTPREQAAFVKGLEFQENQDIIAAQRMEQLRRHRRIRRSINGVKVAMRNSRDWMEFYDIDSTNPRNKSLTEAFYYMAKALHKRERLVTSKYPVVDPLLITTPYNRHMMWLAALLVLNQWAPVDVDLVYDLMSSHVLNLSDS